MMLPADSEPDLSSIRQAYANTLAAAARLRTTGLREALAVVAREQFLPPPPWLVAKLDGQGRGPSSPVPASDPRELYANVAVVIDPHRSVLDGAPASVLPLIDALRLRPGKRVLHVAAGLGYYSAIAAHVVGPSGAVVAVEDDAQLRAGARSHLADLAWVQTRGMGDESDMVFDAVLVTGGATHPDTRWLDRLEVGGRVIVPLTVAMPGAASSRGKGIVVAIERATDEHFTAEMMSMIAIDAAAVLRDAAMETALGQALRRISFPNLSQLRRDPHVRGDACWLHGDAFCLSMAPA